MAKQSSTAQQPPQPKELSAERLGRYARSYAMQPFRSPFHWQLFWTLWGPRTGSLAHLRGLEETSDSAWRGLEPIGYKLVQRFRPKVVVELGTHVGFSALAMGLSLRRNNEGGKLFAVDTWKGDEHAGLYDDSVYQTFLRRINEFDLSSTIVPLRMLFDEARDKVATPIDLLHIDGLHTWDAVKQDWETFSPLVRPGGIVLFHDVRSIWGDVRRFWETLTPHYRTHTILHSNGLGILQMPPAKRSG